MPGFKEIFGSKKAKKVEDDEIEPGELQESGNEIRPGDPRLKGGIKRSNLSTEERRKLDEYRRKKGAT